MRSWLKWAGCVERIEGERLTKGANVLSVEGRRRRRKLRWEDCVKRDLAGLGGEREMGESRGGGESETGSVMEGNKH